MSSGQFNDLLPARMLSKQEPWFGVLKDYEIWPPIQLFTRAWNTICYSFSTRFQPLYSL